MQMKSPLEELTEEEQKKLIDMFRYWEAGKRGFWVLIGIGMIAGAVTSVIILYRHLK